MKYHDSGPLSDSADAERMRQYIDACQAAVDAWQDADMWDAETVYRMQHPHPRYSVACDAIQHAARETGAARARAKQAMWLADSLL